MPLRPTLLKPKSPADVVEWTIEFLGLAPDRITGATVTSSGLSIGAQPTTYTDETVTFWVSGGTVGDEPTVTVTITTFGGRTIQRTGVIPVEMI